MVTGLLFCINAAAQESGASDSWHFPLPLAGKNAGDASMSVTLVKVPTLDAVDVLWFSESTRVEQELARRVNAGVAEQLSLVTGKSIAGKPAKRSVGSRFLYPLTYTNSTPFGGLPVPDIEGHEERFVGTELEFRVDHYSPESVLEGALRWSLHHDMRYPSKYHWRNGPFWGEAKLTYTHFYVFEASAVAPRTSDHPYLLGASPFVVDQAGAFPQAICLALARNAPKRPGDSSSDRNYLQIETVVLASTSEAIAMQLLRRGDASRDGDLLRELLAAAKVKEKEPAVRVVSVQSILTRDGNPAKVASGKLFEFPSGFEPDGGWYRSREEIVYRPENYRCVPNVNDIRNVGATLEVEPYRGSEPNIVNLHFAATCAAASPRLHPLKVNPAFAATDDPVGVEAPEFHDTTITTVIAVELNSIRLVASKTVRSKETATQFVRFLRVTAPFASRSP